MQWRIGNIQWRIARGEAWDTARKRSWTCDKKGFFLKKWFKEVRTVLEFFVDSNFQNGSRIIALNWCPALFTFETQTVFRVVDHHFRITGAARIHDRKWTADSCNQKTISHKICKPTKLQKSLNEYEIAKSLRNFRRQETLQAPQNASCRSLTTSYTASPCSQSNRVRRPRESPQIKYGPNYGPTCHQWYQADVTNISPWCDCHRIGSALLTFWRNGAEPL